MDIGLFTDTFIPIADGVGRVVLAYAETLPKLGAKVTVSAPLYHFGNRAMLPFDLIDYSAVKIPTISQYSTGSPVLDTHYRRRMRAAKIDIAHAHSPFAAGIEAVRIAKSKGIPLVATFHSKYYDDFYKATKSETISKALISNVVSFYEKCDEVWAVSKSTADVLYSYGFKGEITVMPNGVNFRTLDKEKIKQVEELYGIGDKNMLLFVGQINYKKNIKLVLESAALLKKSGEDFVLLLAGRGPDEKSIQKDIEELGLKNNAKLIGHIDDSAVLDALYSRALAFVFPSLYDNAPMVVREAAVMATPSILIDGSSAAEIVEDGVNGFLCDNTPESLFEKLKLLLENNELAENVGQNAKESIPMSWENILSKALKRYEALIESGNYKYKK
ncbi:MAG TPA: glycosyltransferase family 4 protein [Christensenellaceae bacterium]|jgi:1,2-diacylglycerol 3-alpha-glucosyltransferase|nr:glycosyltransferase family 4 protein [Christensenellaceae bacterium]